MSGPVHNQMRPPTDGDPENDQEMDQYGCGIRLRMRRKCFHKLSWQPVKFCLMKNRN